MEDENSQIKMVIPINCPHCEKESVVTIFIPQPSAEVSTREELDPNVGKLLESQQESDEPKDPAPKKKKSENK